MIYHDDGASRREYSVRSLFMVIELLRWRPDQSNQKSHYAPLILVLSDLSAKTASQGCLLRLRNKGSHISMTPLHPLGASKAQSPKAARAQIGCGLCLRYNDAVEWAGRTALLGRNRKQGSHRPSYFITSRKCCHTFCTAYPQFQQTAGIRP